MRGSDYADLRAFATIVEQGSFARAAAHLRVSPSALSQTIRQLEERLGVRLLNRTTRSVAPSEAGERLLARLAPAIRELESAVAELGEFRDTPGGRLRINAPRIAAIHYLAPLVTELSRRYPEVSVEVTVDDSIVDIVRQGYDAGIRLGERLDQDMIAVPLTGEMETAIVAAPDYLARHGVPLTPQDLHRHRCINYRWPTNGDLYRWEFERDGKPLEVSVDGPVTVNDHALRLRAALDGLGIAYLLGCEAVPLIAEGKLVRLLADWSPRFPGFYLYYPGRRQPPPALRALLDLARAR